MGKIRIFFTILFFAFCVGIYAADETPADKTNDAAAASDAAADNLPPTGDTTTAGTTAKEVPADNAAGNETAGPEVTSGEKREGDYEEIPDIIDSAKRLYAELGTINELINEYNIQRLSLDNQIGKITDDEYTAQMSALIDKYSTEVQSVFNKYMKHANTFNANPFSNSNANGNITLETYEYLKNSERFHFVIRDNVFDRPYDFILTYSDMTGKKNVNEMELEAFKNEPKLLAEAQEAYNEKQELLKKITSCFDSGAYTAEIVHSMNYDVQTGNIEIKETNIVVTYEESKVVKKLEYKDEEKPSLSFSVFDFLSSPKFKLISHADMKKSFPLLDTDAKNEADVRKSVLEGDDVIVATEDETKTKFEISVNFGMMNTERFFDSVHFGATAGVTMAAKWNLCAGGGGWLRTNNSNKLHGMLEATALYRVWRANDKTSTWVGLHWDMFFSDSNFHDISVRVCEQLAAAGINMDLGIKLADSVKFWFSLGIKYSFYL